jgi:hypothetical protein
MFYFLILLRTTREKFSERCKQSCLVLKTSPICSDAYGGSTAVPCVRHQRARARYILTTATTLISFAVLEGSKFKNMSPRRVLELAEEHIWSGKVLVLLRLVHWHAAALWHAIPAEGG